MLQAKGNILQGYVVGPNKFQGVTTLAQIQAYGLPRPTLIDKTAKNLTTQQKEAHELHEVTNRRFDKARLDNASDYSGYIEAVEMHNRPGGTPAITLYHRKPLEETERGLLLPYGAGLVAIDGETQTEARFILAERIPESMDNAFAITLYHGIPVETAMQILHDYNTKGLRWSEMNAARFNHTGQISQAAQDAIERSSIKPEQVNYRGSKATRKHLVSLQQIMTGLVGYQLNGMGSQVSVSASHFRRFNDADAISVPPTAVMHFARIISDTKNWTLLGAAPPMLWQIAGVLLSKNRQPSQIDWEAGLKAYQKTATAGRGGERMPIKERLAVIEQAMGGRA